MLISRVTLSSLALLIASATMAEDPAGVVRITDGGPSQPQVVAIPAGYAVSAQPVRWQQSPPAPPSNGNATAEDASAVPGGSCAPGACAPGPCDDGCNLTGPVYVMSSCHPGWGIGHSGSLGSRYRRHRNSYLYNHHRASWALFGWLVPTGFCGQGAPPLGGYHMVYADEPKYFNEQDTQMYAAQGYGVPVTVPLAPNVHYSYNYGWGTPSSRLTPISTVAPFTVGHPYHW